MVFDFCHLQVSALTTLQLPPQQLCLSCALCQSRVRSSQTQVRLRTAETFIKLTLLKIDYGTFVLLLQEVPASMESPFRKGFKLWRMPRKRHAALSLMPWNLYAIASLTEGRLCA